MPDLEQQIAEWRAAMSAAGIESPIPLEELELHLREDIIRHLEAGFSKETAFEICARHFGSPGQLRVEFGKAKKIKGARIMLRIIMAIAGFAGMTLGLGMVLPALARQHKYPELPVAAVFSPLILGAALVIFGAAVALYCIRTRRDARGRIAVAIGLLFACLFYSIAAMAALFHASEMTPVAWLIWATALAVSVVFFGNCFRANWRQPQRA